MHFHDWFIAFSAFISEILGTLSGFGSSTFFVPISSLFEGFKLVLAITSILHCFGNVSKIYLFRKELNLKTFLPYALPFVFMTGVGAFLTTYLTADWLENGGEHGIRTHDTLLRYTPFPRERLRPLGQFSV